MKTGLIHTAQLHGSALFQTWRALLLQREIDAHDHIGIKASGTEKDIAGLGDEDVSEIAARLKVVHDALTGVGQEQSLIGGDDLLRGEVHTAVVNGSVPRHQLLGVGIRQAVVAPEDPVIHVEDLAGVVHDAVVVLLEHAQKSHGLGVVIVQGAARGFGFTDIQNAVLAVEVELGEIVGLVVAVRPSRHLSGGEILLEHAAMLVMLRVVDHASVQAEGGDLVVKEEGGLLLAVRLGENVDAAKIREGDIDLLADDAHFGGHGREGGIVDGGHGSGINHDQAVVSCCDDVDEVILRGPVHHVTVQAVQHHSSRHILGLVVLGRFSRLQKLHVLGKLHGIAVSVRQNAVVDGIGRGGDLFGICLRGSFVGAHFLAVGGLGMHSRFGCCIGRSGLFSCVGRLLGIGYRLVHQIAEGVENRRRVARGKGESQKKAEQNAGQLFHGDSSLRIMIVSIIIPQQGRFVNTADCFSIRITSCFLKNMAHG